MTEPLSSPFARPAAWLLLGAACLAVLAVFARSTDPTLLELAGGRPADAYYNLLVRGFQSGRLSLDRAAPARLAELPDPYDPAATRAERIPPFGVHDLSFYRGRLYLYFGVTPALLLFWPYATLTGGYLYHDTAVLLFCAVGFLAAAGILADCWRRYFPAVPAWIAAAGVLALGLATSVPILLRRAEVWEVPVSCAYALLALALGAVWLALHRPARRGRWLAAGAAALGLAVGARPAALGCVVILLIPIWADGPGRRPRLLAAAVVPLLACGLGLALYNYLRFQSPWEFGQRYQLANDRQDGAHFSARYLWYNLRMYFFQPLGRSRAFPWVDLAPKPPPPAGHALPEDPFGIVVDLPFVLLAAAAPLAWRGAAGPGSGAVRRFGAALAALALLAAAPLLLFYGVCSRYEFEFLPPLLWLAVLGVFGLERALAGRPGWRRAARAGWGLLLAASVAFNLFAGLERYARTRYEAGNTLVHHNQLSGAVAQYEAAIRARPGLAPPHNNLGSVLIRLGRPAEALAEYATAARLFPGSADIRYNYGNLLSARGQRPAAIAQYREALRLQPDFPEAHLNLGVTLAGLNQPRAAADEFARAAEGLPAKPELFYNWGAALAQAGDFPGAQARFAAALRLRPDYAEAHNGLGSVLAQTGHYRAARPEFAEALRLRPNLPRARENLAQVDALLAREGAR